MAKRIWSYFANRSLHNMILRRKQRRLKMQQPPSEPASRIIPDPPEHHSFCSSCLPNSSIGKKSSNTIRAGHQFLVLPDPPEQAQEGLIIGAGHQLSEVPPDPPEQPTAILKPPAHCLQHVQGNKEQSSQTLPQPHYETLIDQPDPPEPQQQLQYHSFWSGVIQNAGHMQQLPMNHSPPLMEVTSAQASDEQQPQMLHPNHLQEATEMQVYQPFNHPFVQNQEAMQVDYCTDHPMREPYLSQMEGLSSIFQSPTPQQHKVLTLLESAQLESELQATSQLQLSNVFPAQSCLIDGEHEPGSHLLPAPLLLLTNYPHQLRPMQQPTSKASQMPQILLQADTEIPPVHNEESSNASTRTSLFSSTCSVLTLGSLFMDGLDAEIESAKKTLAELEQDADAAMSKLDTTTALSIDYAATSYTTLVAEEIAMYSGTLSTTSSYPHSPLAAGNGQKESDSSKVHPGNRKTWKEWRKVLSLGADVGVDIEKIHPATLKRKASDINLDNETGCDHRQSIWSSLREYDLLMNCKGHNDRNGNGKFAKVVVNGVCGKMARDNNID